MALGATTGQDGFNVLGKINLAETAGGILRGTPSAAAGGGSINQIAAATEEQMESSRDMTGASPADLFVIQQEKPLVTPDCGRVFPGAL